MVISILHRVTGDGLAIAGACILVWWITAAAAGAEAYGQFQDYITSPLGYVFLIGLTWASLQHMLSGLRHFAMDMGAGYELQTNKRWSLVIMAAAPIITTIIWAGIFLGVL